MVDSYDVKLDVEKVRGVNISRYNDGYNYANISCKMADSEFMNISYEWKGKQIPEFAMNVMEIMKSMGMEKANKTDETVSEALERASQYFLDRAAKMKKEMKKEMKNEDEMCSECGEPKEKCKCKKDKK